MNKRLLIDKPAGWTSFDVVAKIRNSARAISGNKKIKVGHAGTLDPFATGLLIVLIGNETKNQDDLMKKDKEYEATLRLGYNSTTGDPEGVVTEIAAPVQGQALKDPEQREKSEKRPGPVPPRSERIEEALKHFLGVITQTPPIYSAIKINGKRAYEYARKGQEVEIKSRNVRINKLEVISYNYPELKIRVNCSSGTYIRTLAEDIGKRLGTGAYLTALRRTKIGDYSIKSALNIEMAIESLGPQ